MIARLWRDWPALVGLAAALLIVAALRLLPLGTYVTGDWAELSIRQQLTAQIATRAATSIDLLDPAATQRDIDAWIAANPDEVRSARQTLTRDYRDAIGFTGGDGRFHLYVAGTDSYYWLRLAWLRLQNGMACDRLDDGRCIDGLADAPMGMEIRYAHSPHVLSIAAAHRLLALLVPGIPLESSAFILCLLLSLLSAAAAFVLARRLSNGVGGCVAALLVCGNTVVLQRTAGADNDVWIIGLPLLAAWLATRALDATHWPTRALYALATGGALGLLAASWAGWWLFYLVTLGGIIAAATRRALERDVQWRMESLSASALILSMTAGMLIVAAAFGVPLDPKEPWHEILRIAGLADGQALDSAPWPNTFALVNELAASDLVAFAKAFGPLAFIAGALGLIPALLRRQSCAAATLCAVWLIATAILATGAARYMVLVVVPLGLAAGAGMGWIAEFAAKRFSRARGAVAAAMAILLIAAVAPALYQSDQSARRQSPGLNDAWAESFTALRQHSDPAAIVNVWWDYGHWAKYFSERRTTSDGASLRTRTQHWVARALAVPAPAESVKLLRMGDCGGAIDPDDGARLRPFEMLLKWGADEASAYRTILELTRASNDGRGAYLDSLGLTPPRRVALLHSIDCTPPEGYLVLSTEMMGNLNWLAAGFWNPYRASLVEFARHLPQSEALARIETEFAVSPDVARQAYDEARQVRTEEERKAFSAVDARLFVTKWQPCFPDGAALRCPLAVIDGNGQRWREVHFDPADPARSVINVDGAPGGRLVPTAIQVALPERLVSYAPAESPTANLALLVDPVGRRLFVGTPGVVQSLLTRLLLLDGRYDPAFEKLQEHLAIDGNRVTTWRIRWDSP